MDREVIDLIDKGKGKTREERNILNILEKNDFLIYSENREEDSKEYFDHLWKKEYAYNYHIIIPTYTCNLNCSYCYQKHLRKKKKDLSHEEVDKIFEAIQKFDKGEIDNRESDLKLIQFYGGEPLQARLYDIIEYILEKGTDLGYKFAMLTNSIELDRFESLLEEYKSYITDIQTTLDGPKEIHDSFRHNGAFEKTIENIEEIIDLGIHVSFRTNIGPRNKKHLEDLAKFYIKKGWGRRKNVAIYLSVEREERGGPCYYLPSLSHNELLKIFKDPLIRRVFRILPGFFRKFYERGHWIPQFYHCPAHYNQIFYDPYGDMYTCMNAIGIKDLSIGKYYPKFELNENFKKYRNRNIFNMEKCKSCQYRFICGGGCNFNSYLKTEDTSNPDCKTMENLKEFFRLYKELRFF